MHLFPHFHSLASRVLKPASLILFQTFPLAACPLPGYKRSGRSADESVARRRGAAWLALDLFPPELLARQEACSCVGRCAAQRFELNASACPRETSARSLACWTTWEPTCFLPFLLDGTLRAHAHSLASAGRFRNCTSKLFSARCRGGPCGRPQEQETLPSHRSRPAGETLVRAQAKSSVPNGSAAGETWR